MCTRHLIVGEGDAVNPPIQTPGDNSINIPLRDQHSRTGHRVCDVQREPSAAATGPLAETLTSNQPFLASGSWYCCDAANVLDTNLVNYASGDPIQITGRTRTGSDRHRHPPTATDGTTREPASTIKYALSPRRRPVCNVLPANLGPAGRQHRPEDLTLLIGDGGASTGSTKVAMHNAGPTVEGKDGDTVKTAIQSLTPRQAPHTLSLTFQKSRTTSGTLRGRSIRPRAYSCPTARPIRVPFNDDGIRSTGRRSGAGDLHPPGPVQMHVRPQTINLNCSSPTASMA